MRQHSNGYYRCVTALVALTLGLASGSAVLALQTPEQEAAAEETSDQEASSKSDMALDDMGMADDMPLASRFRPRRSAAKTLPPAEYNVPPASAPPTKQVTSPTKPARKTTPTPLAVKHDLPVTKRPPAKLTPRQTTAPTPLPTPLLSSTTPAPPTKLAKPPTPPVENTSTPPVRYNERPAKRSLVKFTPTAALAMGSELKVVKLSDEPEVAKPESEHPQAGEGDEAQQVVAKPADSSQVAAKAVKILSPLKETIATGPATGVKIIRGELPTHPRSYSPPAPAAQLPVIVATPTYPPRQADSRQGRTAGKATPQIVRPLQEFAARKARSEPVVPTPSPLAKRSPPSQPAPNEAVVNWPVPDYPTAKPAPKPKPIAAVAAKPAPTAKPIARPVKSVVTQPAPVTQTRVAKTPALLSKPVAYQPDAADGAADETINESDLFDDNELAVQTLAAPASERAAPRTLPDTPVEVQQRPNQAGSGMPFEVISSSGELTVTRRRNKILRCKNDIYRVAVVDPTICDVVQFTPREVSIIGKSQGATSVTFWFTDGSHQPITYLVRVQPDPEVQIERERQYQILEEIVAELFPDSKVRLLPVADKLIVRGQAKGAQEAAQIMAVIRGEAVLNRDGAGTNGTVADGQAATPLANEETGTALPAANVINMLRIPGVQQVALKVKIAELNRTAAREFGIDFDLNFNVGDGGALIVQTLLNMAAGSSTSISGTFDNDDINFGIHYLETHDVIRILSEPTLVTLSGHPASFLAGGEFAVPTVVGVDGASGIATDFRSFGVILNFLPTVIDKDRIRLEISPEFSKIDSDLEVNGTPGLNTRAVTTTVEMREGQAFAIAGLLEDSMTSETAGDVPWLAKLLGKRSVSHNETELLILVTPELVHPLEPEEVPPLPGFDVTEPTNKEFFWHGDIEGRPTREYRSTIWPRLRSRYRNGGPSMISGPFGHGQ